MIGNKYVLNDLVGYSVECRFEITDCIEPCVEMPIRTYLITWFDGTTDVISHNNIIDGLNNGKIIDYDPLRPSNIGSLEFKFE